MMRRARPGRDWPRVSLVTHNPRESRYTSSAQDAFRLNSENGARGWFLFIAASITLGQENYVTRKIFQEAKLRWGFI